MFLKSIEIRGFKSFADKTELNFKKGVTTIVGPNGSGKSNISDAVRWVLGEQSVKSLRGGKMEDVIFAGTQFRKPVGLCQVSLVLDNSDHELSLDYSEVTITRRLYRSGESEYYINGTQCRLKDVNQLFMDTGIGKEGYSIIGQGKIEAVLSGKPEERRSILEEAAGIVKFKWRKEEAEKKLENTDQNLVRICDIISTYEDRIEPLKIESEKAKLFLQLSENLKGREVNLIVHSIDKVQNKINLLNNELEDNRHKYNEAKKNNDSIELELQKYNDELEKFDKNAGNEKSIYFESKSKLQSLISDNNLLDERIENINKNQTRISEEIGEIDLKLGNIKKVKDTEVNNVKVIQGEQSKLNNDIVSIENNAISINEDLVSKEEKIKDLKNDQVDILSKMAQKNNDILNLSNENDSIKKRLENLKVSVESYSNSRKINLTTEAMLNEQMKNIKNNIEQYENTIKDKRKKIALLSGTLLKAENDLKLENNLFSKMEANQQMLINLEKQYEGYTRSVKVLMRHIKDNKIQIPKNSINVLGEVIEVKKELEAAIEIALGGAISDIITKDDLVAKKLIGYLKQNNIGRATFLPLNIVKGRNIDSIKFIEKIKGYVGIASNLVNYNNEFKSAVEFLLGRTIIASDMDSALNIARSINYSFKIVTLQGEVVNPGGSLTGGSISHRSSNIISRKREIEEINGRLIQSKNNIDKYSTEIIEIKSEIKELDNICLNLKDKVYQEKIETTKIEARINSIKEESRRLSQNLIVSNNEIENNKKQLDINNENSKKLSADYNLLRKTKEENEKNISDFEDELESKGKLVSEIREKLLKLKIKKAQVDENCISKVKDLERMEKEINELRNRIETLNNEKHQNTCSLEEIKKQIQCSTIKINDLSGKLKSMEENFKNYEVERIKIKEKINIAGASKEQSQLFINKLENELHKIDVAMAKNDAEKESIYNKLNEELEITYAEALKYKSDIDNLDSYKKEVQALKNKISSLGTVNVGSIEEYKDIKEKYTFMSAQKEDLIQAKDELLSVIQDMTNKMKVVFKENFNKLRVNFNETFRELFKGGSADLILSQGDELTGVIDITVQPPGKKLQNINLMSGGEKGLSAIALLFAILKMKPTPFCILDEIEAALDDANVIRYSEFLRKFSSNIQFIVITHRKGTMEASDALYGVTMQEKGVSKIVSVDLVQAL
ncbi:chromosome segregation protein SMC [Clostridium sp. JN-9]|uniref:chromosome segregation protein SMC n=1 Tax=Clostridium sp. JN-9 TaxID=2507159 RepID=UPI000FFE0A46|nr:chromosome segregation protein SMC [Clostridium sp. JN-9]QAT40172.1 chromosome segregation protein SMC [Clostridium sp. JN-9]